MTKQTAILMILSSVFLLSSCDMSDVDAAYGDWFKLSDFDGVARHSSFGFTINNEGYLGSGGDEDGYKLNDFWKYDPEKNTWYQLADFPGLARTASVGLSINGKGYVGTGLDQNDEKLNDFWEYDPITNIWSQKADFMGTARRHAVSFSIGNKGYVGTGFDGSYMKDFYAYDPSADSWEKITSIGGAKRVGAASFVIDGIAYVGTGNNNGVNQTDLWSYNSSTDTWSEELDFDDTDVDRSYGSGFALKGKGYFTGGTSGNDVWQYTPATSLDEAEWNEMTAFEGTNRNYAVTWAILDEAYIATGSNSIYRFDDIWKYTPDIVQDDEDED